jgi:hypothetical protein
MYDYTDFYIFLGGTIAWALLTYGYVVIKSKMKGGK